MAFKKVIVTLHEIFNENTGEDPGDALEVFGRFDVRRLRFRPEIGQVVVMESHNLFDKGEGDAQSIVEGTAFKVEKGVEMTFEDRDVMQILGVLTEHDSTSPQ